MLVLQKSKRVRVLRRVKFGGYLIWKGHILSVTHVSIYLNSVSTALEYLNVKGLRDNFEDFRDILSRLTDQNFFGIEGKRERLF